MGSTRLLVASVAFGLSFGLVSGALAQAVADRAGVPPAVAPPSEALETAARAHVEFLASDRLGGRLPGTPGIELAADYIQLRFLAAGLEPAFGDGDERSFRQSLERGQRQEIRSAGLDMTLADGESVSLEAGLDFNLLGYGGSGEGSMRVTFVGYSIAAGNDGYIGYGPITNLNGRVALMLRFEPFDETGQSKWVPEGWSFNAGLVAKISAAARRGAAAVVVVNPPNADDETVDVLMDLEGTPPVGDGFDCPVFQVTPEVADRLVRAGDPEGRSLDDLIEIANEEGIVVEFEGVSFELDATIDREAITTDNIGGLLPGKGDLADELIVVGAHYDHIGTGLFGSRSPDARGQIHPGADDNASGTSGLLLAAERLAADYQRLDEDVEARSILFLAFTAEESGLDGSRFYVENPVRPLDAHYAMLNMDMIGRYGERLEVGGIGTSEALPKIVAPHFEASGFEILTSLSIGSGRSDHANFDRQGIPNMFFFTGLHDDYHAVGDTADKINIEGLTRIASMVTNIAFDLASREEPLPYARPDADRDQQEDGPGRTKITVRVGIAPSDYSGRGGGIVVARVFENTSASEAGLEVGDRIILWDGQEVPNVSEWMPILVGHEPGDIVRLKVMRAGEEMDLDMTLRAPDRGSR